MRIKRNSVCLNSNKTYIYFKTQILYSRDILFNKELKLTLSSDRMMLDIIFRCLECNPEN